MDLPQVHATSSPVSVRFIPLSFLLCLSSLATFAFGQKVDHSDTTWRATVTCQDVPVYSQMSIESMIVKYLRDGDVVTIDLEIVGSDQPWSLVRQEGRRVRLGFMQSDCLERAEPVSMSKWQSQSPGATVSSLPDSDLRSREPLTASPLTREEIDQEIERAVTATLSRILSGSGTDQTPVTGDTAFENQELLFVPFPTAGIWDPFFSRRPVLRFNRFGRVFPLTDIGPSFRSAPPPPGRFSIPHLATPRASPRR
jgi:hypothetical protein